MMVYSYPYIVRGQLNQLILKYVFFRTAYDVAINDDFWPTEAFELVSGEKTKTLEKLDP
jgi:hypothetical protein